MQEGQVLIVGAGPTGLVLALSLLHQGIPFRLIEKNAGPGQQSRAIVVHARTLEFYRQLDFADEVVSRGIKIDSVHVHESGQDRATFPLGDIGEGLSPYPFVLSFPQDDHEKFLGEQLPAAGVSIKWNTELVGFTDDGERVHCVLRKEGTEEEASFAYLCGCDGAHSVVRHALEIGFPGGAYDQVFFVADVAASGDSADGDMHVFLGQDALCLLFPIRSSGMYRIIGILPKEVADREGVTFEDFQPSIESLIGIKVETVNWFSTYRVHHRVAEHFRKGRAFLCGDAGHIHSPAGGQGMNTGIGDAFNLGWKIAAVLKQQAKSELLDTYESERIAFAHQLVETTDRAFRVGVGHGIGSQMLRTMLIPHLVPFALGFSGVRKAAFRFVSQTRISYRDSKLSEGWVGDIHGGDRLPWVGDPDNFEPMVACRWQIHIYGTVDPALREAAARNGVRLNEFPWNAHCAAAGLEKDAFYLLRPDSYLALVNPYQSAPVLERYLAKWGLRPSEPAENTHP